VNHTKDMIEFNTEYSGRFAMDWYCVGFGNHLLRQYPLLLYDMYPPAFHPCVVSHSKNTVGLHSGIFSVCGLTGSTHQVGNVSGRAMVFLFPCQFKHCLSFTDSPFSRKIESKTQSSLVDTNSSQNSSGKHRGTSHKLCACVFYECLSDKMCSYWDLGRTLR
jgi:hypothetical protein